MRFAASVIALATPLFVAAAPWKRGAATNLLVLRTLPFPYLFFLLFAFVPVLCL